MRILVTGGAGFIGSNLIGGLLKNPEVRFVRALDNLSTGRMENVEAFLHHPRFQLIQGDIRSVSDCQGACRDIDAISHQAALGSVPRSIKSPATSHDVNVTGFINILEAAREHRIKRIVYASSSSVYGDLAESPKTEDRTGRVLSPYAATKMANEGYAEAYSRSYGMQLLGFRYFNVFGPGQDPNGPYAAVIPLFIKAALTHTHPVINGDGSITRDFTPVSNVIQANIKGLLIDRPGPFHEVLNIACGRTTTLDDLWEMIRSITGAGVTAIHGAPRQGDITASLADITKAIRLLDYQPDGDLQKHLTSTIKDFKSRYFSHDRQLY